MAFQVSPGINITEKDLTTVVPNVSTNIGAVAGAYQWGPVLERTSVISENDFVEKFGKPNTATQEHWWCAANFLAYSNNLIVSRVVGAAAKNAQVGDVDDGGTAVIIKNVTHYDSQAATLAGGTSLFVAKYPGELGNSLNVRCIDSNAWSDSTATAGAGADGSSANLNAVWKANFDTAPGTSADVLAAGGSNDECHVLVIDESGLWTGVPGEILERFAYVSKASDAKRSDGSSNYIGDVLRNESKYVWLGRAVELTSLSTDASPAVHAGTAKAGAAFKTFSSATAAQGVVGGKLTLGESADAPTTGELQAGYTLFGDAETSDVTLLIGTPGSSGTEVTTSAHIISIAAARKDCMAFVSPAKDSVVHSGTDQISDITGNKTTMSQSNSYGAMDSAWKYQYDRYQDKFIYVPMCADVAGLCAKVDYTHDAWWSPAGITRGAVKNIVKLSWEPTKADRDSLYKIGVNPFITQTGSGVVLWGDKTMQTAPTAFDHINVRRLFIVLEKAISNAAKSMLFEFNDEFTRSQFVNMVEPFLREVQGRRGITDFKVVCDGSNNTGEVVDANNFVGDIYVKPSRSINYIQLNFIAARTDVNFTEIGG
jgi:phage tail sheath protein FI